MSIAENLERIHQHINSVCMDRPVDNGPVKLIAVSKYHTIDNIKEAYADGQRVFAENRVQEMLPKIEAMNDAKDIEWHLIGHLQKNKVRQVVGKVAMIQSVDSIDLLHEIEKRAIKADCDVNILLQVNVAKEEQKSGIAYEDIDAFVEEMAKMTRVYLKGLMFIAPNLDNKEDLKPYFRKLSDKFQVLKNHKSDHVEMQWLSMGMSGDYEVAVYEGANMVRIGSAIFNV
ncbi:MAG: YggS family pyridoxal phosphate-dependent enzyme [Peptococcaceae bacterium]|nr:YggS family pyridoxal phosphate-dependent enzyme [Peptococcaceae bacterium]